MPEQQKSHDQQSDALDEIDKISRQTAAGISIAAACMSDIPVYDRVVRLRRMGLVIERRRMRGTRLGAIHVLTRKREIRIAIEAPRGRFYYCKCIVMSY